MPHKGLPVLDGRLDPKVWGRLPIRNMLIGVDGEMLLHGYGAHTIIGAGDPRVSAGTGSNSGTELLVTTNAFTDAAVADVEGTIASLGKAALAGNRFVLECNVDLAKAAEGALFLGFAASRTAPLPADLTAGIELLKPASFGLFKSSESSDLVFAFNSGDADADTDVSGTLGDSKTLADDSALKVKVVADGKGRIEVTLGEDAVKKFAYPGVADGYLVLAVKSSNDGTADQVLSVSSLAFGVAE
jgi:hypothetical protein